MKLFVSIFLFSNFTIGAYALAFDMPKMPTVPSVPSVQNLPQAPVANPEVEKKINSFLKKNSEANQFMQKSLDSLFKIVAPKEKAAKVEAYLKKVEAITDEKQKAAAFKKAYVVQNQVINQIMSDEKAMKALGGLGAQDKISLGKILYNLHLAIMVDKELVNEGPEVLKTAGSDPLVVKRVDEIKFALNETKDQMENAQKLIVGVGKLAGMNGLKVDLPKTSNDVPQ